MKVSQFNTFPYGGAATAAKRIHGELQSQGVDSQYYYHRNDNEVETDSSFHQLNFVAPKYGIVSGAVHRRLDKRRQREVYRQFNEHIATRPVGVETFSMAQLPHPTPMDWSAIDSDVVHLHWISFFADYPTFFGSIPNHVPLVWTLHDMNAFTGGCHYSNACSQFRFGCGDCHQVTNSSPKDVSYRTFETKKRALRNKQNHVVTPSDWLNRLAQQSKIWPKNTTFQTIKLGFDLQTFHPVEKSAARKKLGIDTDAVLIGFGAEDINNRRKGIQHLLSALRKNEANRSNESAKVECLLFGSGKIEDQNGLPKMHEMGYVDSAKQQTLIYSASDLVVVPSREDNQPQVGLEAMACETPVVGFNAGGIPEYVRHEKTGLLASLGNEDELASKIQWLANNSAARVEMGKNAREMMEQEFELGSQTQKYIELYQSAAGIRKLQAA